MVESVFEKTNHAVKSEQNGSFIAQDVYYLSLSEDLNEFSVKQSEVLIRDITEWSFSVEFHHCVSEELSGASCYDLVKLHWNIQDSKSLDTQLFDSYSGSLIGYTDQLNPKITLSWASNHSIPVLEQMVEFVLKFSFASPQVVSSLLVHFVMLPQKVDIPLSLNVVNLHQVFLLRK